MSKKVGIELSQQELNELYYCIETINRRDFRPDMSERLNLLGDKIGEEVYQLAKEEDDLGPEYDSAGFTEDDRIVNGQYRVTKEQLEEDKLNHEMNFKYAFAKHGDY